MTEREKIIDYLKRFAIEKQYVYAMWLEGADGIGQVDEYSDLDFWFDVEKSHQESFLYECVAKLGELAGIDSRVDMVRPEIAQSNIHLENTSEYLTLDICVQSHELRGKEATRFAENDIAEQPLVLFDKDHIISFYQYELNADEVMHALAECRNRILQSSRVTKYIERDEYPEAYMKYLENVVEPLVKAARLIYTPKHCEYGLCHISRHLPEPVVGELEAFCQVTCLEDIAERLPEAERLYAKYEREVREKYGTH